MKILKVTSSILLFAALSYFTWLMIEITYPHFSLDPKEGFLRIKQSYMGNKVWLASFYTHVFTSCLLLLAGFTQFSKTILNSYPKLHRWAGWSYMVVLLLFSAPAGFIMSIYANGGAYSKIAFLTLSTLWITSTLIALGTVLKKKYSAHGKWMMISYALTLSALTLRAWKFLLSNYWDDLGFEPIRPMDMYRIVAWLGWVPNLLFALVLIAAKRHIKLLDRIKTRVS